MKGSSLSTIGRPVGIRVPSNRAIVVLAVLVAAGGGAHAAVVGQGLGPSLLQGIVLAGTAFLGWALGREVDPDHPLSAFLAVGPAVAGTVFLGPPGFLLLFFVLVGLRLINRTPGLPAGIVDSIGFVALGLLKGIHHLLQHRGDPWPHSLQGMHGRYFSLSRTQAQHPSGIPY